MSDISLPPKLYGQLLRGGKSRWLRVGDLPFSRAHTYRLIAEDLLFSVEVKRPGSSRTIRLIDGDSLDQYLLKLGRRQRAAKATKSAGDAV
ncbi:MAG: hypothetical protein JO076_14810 [Verrucomicrobia bacterium]|nr:hypothetical protein [Verrucomicrobiota bacterium]